MLTVPAVLSRIFSSELFWKKSIIQKSKEKKKDDKIKISFRCLVAVVNPALDLLPYIIVCNCGYHRSCQKKTNLKTNFRLNERAETRPSSFVEDGDGGNIRAWFIGMIYDFVVKPFASRTTL